MGQNCIFWDCLLFIPRKLRNLEIKVLESGFVFLQKEMGLCMRKDGDLQDVVSKIAIGDPSVKNKKEDLVEEKAKGAMKTQSKSAETLSIRVFGDSCANVSFPSHSSGEAQTSSSVPMEQAGIRASSNMIPTSIPQTQARAQVRQQVNPPLTPNPSAAIESIGKSKTLTPIISNTLSSMQHIIKEVEKEKKEDERKCEQNQLAQISSNDDAVRTTQDKSEHTVKLAEEMQTLTN
ncbi:hypothetical protein RFI_40355 [Reticulomyxa filosa]|uniref:Uncharacterized protein n=1 Tax=Reticulomyxa filosa TaxID=46433 RepID=X6L820_RETFI|nr:hypothetical protein RFI_40355 [Reticulomyxa filosa]|eukprot:ETN97176.1 hypothetical protein RFI_40355 [Reticulomyxa filosa]